MIIIDYVELLDAPTPSSASTHSDWIAAIDNRLYELHQSFHAEGSTGSYIAYGAYDSQISLLDSTKQEENNVTPWLVGLHSQPVLSVSTYFRRKNVCDLASCSQDGTVSVWNVDVEKTRSTMTHNCVGHEGAVEHVEFDPLGKLLATSSWDDTIKIWDLNDEVELDGADRKSTKKAKKSEDLKAAKTAGAANVEARSTFIGHNQCVSVLQWISSDQIVSGSWDHSLRFWDVDSGVCTQHFDGNKVILSLDYSPLNGLVATGHADKTVRTWDPRVSVASTSLSTAYTSHTGWVSAVLWHPTNPHLFISGSFDTHIKVWDLRSTTPIHTLPSQHKDKVTCLSWLDNDHFVSGGADKYIRTYTFTAQSTVQ